MTLKGGALLPVSSSRVSPDSCTPDCWRILQKLILAPASILQTEINTEWEGLEREPSVVL